MGATGTYMDYCPKGKERIEKAIEQEGLNYSRPDLGIESKVIDCTMVNNVVYCAVRYINVGNGRAEVYGTVITTFYAKNRQEFITKEITEDMGPGYYDCPKRILDKLSEANSEYAKEWRKKCEEVLKAKKSDILSKIEFGKAIRLTGEKHGGTTLYAYKLRKTKVFVDWVTNRYFTQKQVRRIGYEVV